MRCELKGEGREASLVFAERDAVDPDCGGRHGAFKVDEDTFASGGRGILEATPIGGDKLVVLVVEAMPRQLHIGMGNDNSFEGRIVETGEMRALYFGWVIAPVAIHGKH